MTIRIHRCKDKTEINYNRIARENIIKGLKERAGIPRIIHEDMYYYSANKKTDELIQGIDGKEVTEDFISKIHNDHRNYIQCNYA